VPSLQTVLPPSPNADRSSQSQLLPPLLSTSTSKLLNQADRHLSIPNITQPSMKIQIQIQNSNSRCKLVRGTCACVSSCGDARVPPSLPSPRLLIAFKLDESRHLASTSASAPDPLQEASVAGPLAMHCPFPISRVTQHLTAFSFSLTCSG